MADYNVKAFTLNGALNRQEVVAPGVAVMSICVLVLGGILPNGHVQLRIGAKGDPITLTAAGTTFDLAVPETTGITFDYDGADVNAPLSFLIGQGVVVES